MRKIREPVVSGQFYESDEKKLIQSIEQCFLDTRGPGRIPSVIKEKKEDVKGVVVPHAGYVFSGPIAAFSYYELAAHGFADTFIILGPNHTGMGSGVSIMTQGEWKTPLGVVPINEDLANRIAEGVIDIDETAHLYEHSIEVQLPFLQFIAKGKKFDFIPICMGLQDYETSKETGEIISREIKKTGKKVVVIASSDFSHVGFNYMSTPPSGLNVDEYTRKQDEKALEKILELKPFELVEVVHRENISMCGYGPVTSMLVAAKKLNAKETKLLKYGTSYEVQPGSSCVGYAAIAVY